MGRTLHQGAGIGHGAGALLGIDDAHVRPAGDIFQGRLLQGHPQPGPAVGHLVQHGAGAVQLPPIQVFCKGADILPPVAPQGGGHGHQTGEAGAGDLRVCKGDMPPKGGGEQVVPPRHPGSRQQLVVINEHHGQGGKGGPQPVCPGKPGIQLVRIPGSVGGEAVGIGRQPLHAAAEHHVGPGGLLLLVDAL